MIHLGPKCNQNCPYETQGHFTHTRQAVKWRQGLKSHCHEQRNTGTSRCWKRQGMDPQRLWREDGSIDTLTPVILIFQLLALRIMTE